MRVLSPEPLSGFRIHPRRFRQHGRVFAARAERAVRQRLAVRDHNQSGATSQYTLMPPFIIVSVFINSR